MSRSTIRWRAWTAALPLCAMLGLMACGGDGCGGDPNAQKAPPPASSGGSGPAPTSGGGAVDVSNFDGGQGQAPSQAPAAQAPAPQQAAPQAAKPASPSAPEQTKAAPLAPIAKPDWDARVLRSTEPVFVMVTGRSCADCDLVTPILRQLAPDFPRWSFYRLDEADPDAKSMLPRGMTPFPLPAFVIYDKGWAHSRRQGLPFARKKGELDVDYQTRLSRWFRTSLDARTFAFTRR